MHSEAVCKIGLSWYTELYSAGLQPFASVSQPVNYGTKQLQAARHVSKQQRCCLLGESIVCSPDIPDCEVALSVIEQS